MIAKKSTRLRIVAIGSPGVILVTVLAFEILRNFLKEFSGQIR